MLPNILLGKLFQKASTMDDKEKGLYTFSQAEMAEGMKTSPILIDTRFIYSVTVGAVDHAGRHRLTRKLVQLT